MIGAGVVDLNPGGGDKPPFDEEGSVIGFLSWGTSDASGRGVLVVGCFPDTLTSESWSAKNVSSRSTKDVSSFKLHPLQLLHMSPP